MYLVVVDAKSKWIEVLSMSSTTAAATVRALRFLFSVHGLPEEIVSDNGPQFVAQEMTDFLKLNGIRQTLSSPYHPASNGEAERAVRTFKDAMKIRKHEEGSTGEKLARFLLGYRTTPHTATGCTPAEILMGRRLLTRLDILHPRLSAKMERKSKHLPQSLPRNFEIGDPVMVKDYRQRTDPWIKGVIQMRLSPVRYRVQVGDLFWKRHVDQLRSLARSKVADNVSPFPNVVSSQPSISSHLPTKDVNGSIKDNQVLLGKPSVTPTLTQGIHPPPPDEQEQTPSITKERSTTNDGEELGSTRKYSARIRTKPKRLIEEI